MSLLPLSEEYLYKTFVFVLLGTHIENGSRYLQIINCAPTLPNRTDFGRFEVRFFADNNRTQCLHCKQTNHPSYACRQKPTWQKRCYNCNDLGHLARDCMSAPTCSFCKQEGGTVYDLEISWTILYICTFNVPSTHWSWYNFSILHHLCGNSRLPHREHLWLLHLWLFFRRLKS
jgi:hypothetical protein